MRLYWVWQRRANGRLVNFFRNALDSLLFFSPPGFCLWLPDHTSKHVAGVLATEAVKFGARKLSRYLWYCCFGENIAWWQMLFWCFTCCLMSLQHLVHLGLFSAWFSDTRDTFTSLFGDRSGIWKFLHFLDLWNQKTRCFQLSLKSVKISERFYFWTFGFLEFAPVFVWRVVMMSISSVFGHSDCIWMFITSVSFGSQKERRSHNTTEEHNSQDTVTLLLWLEKGTQSCCRTWSDVLWTQLGFVAVFLTLSLP